MGEKCARCRLARVNGQQQFTHAGAGSPVPGIVHDVLRAPGQPLDASALAWLEPRLGHDLRNVHVHTDAQAAKSAQAVNARTYTVGNNIVFNTGQYEPRTKDGRRLLAHELTHVVQQADAAAEPQKLSIGQPGDGFEQEANAATADPENHYINDRLADDQANGCRYRSEDFPSVDPINHCQPGDVYDLFLNFREERRNGVAIQSEFWTAINRRFVAPVEKLKKASDSLQQRAENGREREIACGPQAQ
jgi:hypothetical protein